MAITFDLISSTNRVPSTQIENDGSRALALQSPEPQHVLMLGIRKSTGTVAQYTATDIVGETDGDTYFGAKSMLAEMCRQFKRVNRNARLTAFALNEAAGGTAGTCTFAITGTATETATFRVRIGDVRFSVSVASGDTHTATGVTLAAAITAHARLPYTASSTTGTVTATCNHKGECSNAFTTAVEAIPAGLSCTATDNVVAGATNPTMSTAIASFPVDRYDVIVTGLTDATSMTALEAEMARRDGPVVDEPGVLIGAIRGTHSAMVSIGDARNSRFSCLVGQGKSPTAPWTTAAQVAARDCQVVDTGQPNRPRNGLTLPDVEAPALADRIAHADRNLELFDGIATLKADNAGNVMIERLITTYQTDANSIADATYLDLATMRNLNYLRLSVQGVGSKFSAYVLVPDGTATDPGVKALSPKQFEGELKAWYALQVKAARCSDEAFFADNLVVEINATDAGRLDTQMPVVLASGLVTMAIQNQFRLSSPTA